jgi:CRP/FNR family transcriptional regulator
MEKKEIIAKISFLGIELAEKVIQDSDIKEIAPGIEILKELQYVNYIPIVLEGLVKVNSKFEERELLLYYIQPSESCVMSFSAVLQNQPSKVFAVTEKKSTILLMPASRLPFWLQSFPAIHKLFFREYDKRYTDLLDTIHQVLFNNMDKRVIEYLVLKSKITGEKKLGYSPTKIAGELGTVREVISRVIKKLDEDGKVKIENNIIEIV